MKRLLLAFGLVLGLSACGGSLSTHESLTLVDDAIAATSDNAVIAVDQGYLSRRDACAIHEYGRLAGAINDEAWRALVLNRPDDAESLLERAREAMLGISAEAQARVEDNCGGSP